MASLLFRIGTLALLVAVVAPGNVSHWYARSEPRDQGWLLRRLCRCCLLYRPFFLTGATFFAVAPCDFAAALCNRQRFFVAAMILAIPSLLIRRLGFGAFGVAGNVPLIAAHRFFCASAIRRRVAAERLRVGTSGVAVSPPPPESMARSSTILPSMRVFSTSYPMMAAVMSSGSSFVGIDASIE